MAAMKRTTTQRAADLVIIESLALMGKTEIEIAGALAGKEYKRPYTLSRQQIGYDLRKLAKMWEAEAVASLDKHKALALAEIRNLQRTYWKAWLRSCKDAETLRQEGSGEKPDRVITIKKGQAGDPRFLAGVQWCIERRCKLLGLETGPLIGFGDGATVNVYLPDNRRDTPSGLVIDVTPALLVGDNSGGNGREPDGRAN